jgi:putative SOS response-associated peptidase YedK
MCGRFLLRAPPVEIAQLFEIAGPAPNFPARYNIAPTQDVTAVRFNPATGMRSLDALRWGLVPPWAKELAFGNRCINARSEGLADKAAFRDAFAERRCLIPVSGFYEWRRTGAGKTPYVILPADGDLFVFAGLWERWRDPVSFGIVRSCTIVTCAPNEAMATLHDRMPVILDQASWSTWLGEMPATPSELTALLRPCRPARLRLEPVSARVNNVRNDDPSLADPMRADGGLLA